MTLKPFLTTALCATLCACAVGPDYKRPTAPVSTAFKEADGWSVAAPADTLDRGDWWALFNDPALNDLEARVQVSNQNIAAAEAAYRQARALVRQQRSALFPTVDLGGDASRSGGGSNAGGTRSSYRVDIGASWEVDLFGRIRRTIEAARANAQASEADLAAVRLAAQGELAANYFGLRAADAELALSRATVEGYQRTLQITQNRYNAGIAQKSDVLQAQTQLDNARADLAGVQQTRAVYEHVIAVLVGSAPADFTLPALTTWAQAAPQVPVGVPSTLLQRRPDIASAERRVAAANAQVGVAAAAFFPDLVLSGSYGVAGSAVSGLFSASNVVWSLGASSALTLLDFGARRAQSAQAKAAYDQTVAEYRQTVLTALQDVEDQLTATRVLTEQETLRRSASAAADQTEQIALNRYKAGQVNYTEVVTAQTSAFSARRALVQATLSRQATAVALIQALGGGWHAPSWRLMNEGDLDAVVSVAALAFPDHFENRACFAERLALSPNLCFALGDPAQGYLIAYPWTLGAIPPLNTLIGQVAESPETLYLHDLALHPDARGGGHAASAVAMLVEKARKLGAQRIALVSVNNSAAFWAGLGFAETADADLRRKLATYGDNAIYMVREL